MTYKINKTDGSLLAEVVDSAIDQTTTDITLIGKNVSGYGEIINENFVKILENFANTSSPNNPITGQLWFDTAQNRLKVYDGNGFRIGSGPIVTGTAPTNLVQGDIWIDSVENQLHFFDGTDLQLAGPVYKDSQGLSGFTVESIYDSNNALRHLVYLWASATLIGIFSKYTFNFEPRETIPGFSGTIKPGFNAGTLTGMKFNVTASAADSLLDNSGNAYTVDNFLNTTDSLITANGTLSLTGDTAATPSKLLLLGGSVEMHVSSSQFKIESINSSITNFAIRVKNGSGTKDAITINAQTEKVGIFDTSPDYTLDVAGSVRAQYQLILPSYTTADRDAKTSINGEVIYNTDTSTVQAYAGSTWVDLH